MGKPIVLDEQNFQGEVIESDQPVMVDFWAEWCGPCHAVAPVVEKLAGDYEGRAKVGKVNIDANQNLAGRYEIRAIPTLLFFKGGEVVDRVVGVPGGRKVLAEKLDSLLG